MSSSEAAATPAARAKAPAGRRVGPPPSCVPSSRCSSPAKALLRCVPSPALRRIVDRLILFRAAVVLAAGAGVLVFAVLY
ncbi:hypothetical protein [Streptomyces sp. YS415]|uniref:hypothetical protein n=1 Tax=Streptomyces sp. YS415 TaxID=2944806 RepID=UPI00202254FA|nr:hypothetical protein [Streptomyces sp. YS415]MCL7429011.1 hypothetical protein [Streptomyces sp. YS415]